MSKARLLITAVIVEQRPVREVAAAYGVSRSWVYELVARYRLEGDVAFTPRSKRPHRTPTTTSTETVELICAIRRDLVAAGLDAGMATIAWHLRTHHAVTVSESTIHRCLVRAGLVTPAPKKRPKNSYIRFQAELPNECWQADMTHYRLRDGTDAEVLTWIDDHSRFVVSLTAHRRVNGSDVVDTFTHTTATQGIPYSTLTDNAMIFTTRLSGGRGGRNAFEAILVRFGVIQKNSRPNHPTTCGKVERFQQTLKRWLRTRPDQPATIEDLQHLLDTFADHYNHRRPHRSLPHHSPPAVAYHARPKATPTGRTDTHWRVRHDRVDHHGKTTLRHNGHLYKIGIGRPWARTPIIMLIADLDIRILNAATGEIIRNLTLDTTRTYQPTGRPVGAPRKRTNPNP